MLWQTCELQNQKSSILRLFFVIFFQPKPFRWVSVGKIKQASVQQLLKQLHPKPSLEMRVEMYGIEEAKGLWACLRAYNDQLVHIVFRIHAEFALTDGWLHAFPVCWTSRY